MLKNCEFEGNCNMENIDCEVCTYNLYVYLDSFDWNEDSEDPSQVDLDDAMDY